MEDGKPIVVPNRSNTHAAPIAQPDRKISLRQIRYRYIFLVHRSFFLSLYAGKNHYLSRTINICHNSNRLWYAMIARAAQASGMWMERQARMTRWARCWRCRERTRRARSLKSAPTRWKSGASDLCRVGSDDGGVAACRACAQYCLNGADLPALSRSIV